MDTEKKPILQVQRIRLPILGQTVVMSLSALHMHLPRAKNWIRFMRQDSASCLNAYLDPWLFHALQRVRERTPRESFLNFSSLHQRLRIQSIHRLTIEDIHWLRTLLHRASGEDEDEIQILMEMTYHQMNVLHDCDLHPIDLYEIGYGDTQSIELLDRTIKIEATMFMGLDLIAGDDDDNDCLELIFSLDMLYMYIDMRIRFQEWITPLIHRLLKELPLCADARERAMETWRTERMLVVDSTDLVECESESKWQYWFMKRLSPIIDLFDGVYQIRPHYRMRLPLEFLGAPSPPTAPAFPIVD